MEADLVRFVLPPVEEPTRRALLAAAEALRATHAEVVVETVELLDLPSFGRMPSGPAVVVSDRPLPLPDGAVGVNLVASWAIDPLWARNRGHLWAVLHQGLKESLEAQGIPRERIVTTGMPVAPATQPVPKAAARERLALAPGDSGQVVAALLEGLEPASLAQALFQFTLLDPPATVVFFVGGDSAARRLLRREVPVHELNARLLSDPRHLHLVLAAADVAVASSEALPSSEVLGAGLPTVIVPTPRSVGDQAARFLAKQGAARVAAEVPTLSTELDLLRRDADARSSLRARAGALIPSEPMAGFLKLIERALARREELLTAKPAPAAPAAHKAGAAVAGSLPAPPLEDLGGVDPWVDDVSSLPRPEPRGTADPPRPRAGEPPKRRARPSLRSRGAHELRSLAELIAAEKSARARFEECSRERGRWQRRAALANSAGDAELRELAVRELRHLEARLARLTEELERLARRRILAGHAKGPAPSDAESRFRRLELDAELDDLKRRMDSM